MMLPFMKKLALSPKAEQTGQMMDRLLEMAPLKGPAQELLEGYGAIPQRPSPWARLKSMIPESGGMVSNDMALYPEKGSISFGFKPRGTVTEIGGSLRPGEAPHEAHLAYMGSLDPRRMGTGDLNTPMTSYTMDISSAPNRELPFRGMKLSVQEKANRPVRVPEERSGFAPSEGPQATMAQRQAAADKFMALLRGSGFKNLTFDAEAGERPRLYEKLTGYKAQPKGETTMESLLGRMPGRQQNGPQIMRLAPRPASDLEEHQVEQMLGLSIHEAHDMGLVRETAPFIYNLTDAGQRAAQNWAHGMGV